MECESLPTDNVDLLKFLAFYLRFCQVINNFSFKITESCEQHCWRVEHVQHCPQYCWQHCKMWMPVFPAIFEHVAGNLLSVDGSATQLPAILLAILLEVDAPLRYFIPKLVF